MVQLMDRKINFIFDVDNSIYPIYDIIPSISILYHKGKSKIEFNFNWFNLWIGIRIWKRK